MLDPSLDGPIVSRETLEKVKAYEDLVRQWSPRINLVSPADLDCLRHRHTLDSAQLVALSNTPQRWVDLGSGGGFPGIVVAIILQDRQKSARVTVVESDKRKCAFLTTVARSLDLDVDVLAQRAEDLKLTDATTLSARALAPLDRLLAYAHSILSPKGTALFPKGRNWKNELLSTKDKWSFDCDVVQSVTDRDAAILKLRNIKRI